MADLSKRVPALDRMSRRFDEWESCLTMVGVTEYGDPRSGFGYHFESLDRVDVHARHRCRHQRVG